MRELAKALCVVVLLFGVPLAALAWFDGKSDFLQPAIQFWKYGLPLLCIAAIVVYMKIHFRADVAPDYLSSHGTFINRGGFCFKVLPIVVDGVCFVSVFFQNQYENRSIGRVALRPARGFFLGRAKMKSILVEIDCGPAAFGIARVAVPLPAALQGRRQSFEVGASVEYPDGKGRQLRFRDGVTLRANSNFGNAFATGLLVAGALTGQIVYESPATLTFVLPEGVAEEIADPDELARIDTLWKLGDPPLSAEQGR